MFQLILNNNPFLYFTWIKCVKFHYIATYSRWHLNWPFYFMFEARDNAPLVVI